MGIIRKCDLHFSLRGRPFHKTKNKSENGSQIKLKNVNDYPIWVFPKKIFSNQSYYVFQIDPSIYWYKINQFLKLNFFWTQVEAKSKYRTKLKLLSSTAYTYVRRFESSTIMIFIPNFLHSHCECLESDIYILI